MFSEKNASEILKDQEDKHWEKMAESADKDFSKLENFARKCTARMLQNKLYIVNNKEIFDAEVIGEEASINKFEDLIEELKQSEDIINSKIHVKVCPYKDKSEDGFKVFYPQLKRRDITPINVEIICSVSDFIQKVIYSQKTDSKKTFYRGHANWDYELIPGIYRTGKENILLNESKYIREIVSSHPQYFTECKTALDFLSVLQHNGFPTRLLDFSENPLIALYMACDNENPTHADTIKIDVPNNCFKYYDSDTVSVLANVAFFDDNFNIEDFNFHGVEDEKSKFNKRKDIKRLVHQICNEKPYFEARIIPEHLNSSIVFVKPKQNFDRISHQSGLFALFGICKNKANTPTIEMMNPPCEITHYIIPANCKKKILQELSCINITEANVYCDMEHISNYYVKKSQDNTIEKIIQSNIDNEREQLEAAFK